MSARRVVVLAAAVLAVAGCGGGSPDGPPNGRAVIASRSSTLSVGDTMTLSPGVQYNDGRWVPLDSAKLSVQDTSFADINQATKVMRGKKPGTATVTLEITQVGSISRNFSIIP